MLAIKDSVVDITDRGRSIGAMVLGKLPVLGRPTIRIIVGQGPIVLAVGAGGGCLDIFTLVYHFSVLSHSLWETTRCRLKYCPKGPLSPKQTTNQPTSITGGAVVQTLTLFRMDTCLGDICKQYRPSSDAANCGV